LMLGDSSNPFEYWGEGSNMAALLKRFQSGLIWIVMRQ